MNVTEKKRRVSFLLHVLVYILNKSSWYFLLGDHFTYYQARVIRASKGRDLESNVYFDLASFTFIFN